MRPRPDTTESGTAPAAGRPRRAAGLSALLFATLAVVVILVVADPFGASAHSGSGVVDNAYPTSTATVARMSLSSQTSIGGSLGYVGDDTVRIPAGTAQAEVAGDQQAVASAETRLKADQAALAQADAIAGPENQSSRLAADQAVSTARAKLAGARSQLAAAERARCAGTGTHSCGADQAAVSAGQTALSEAEDALSVEEMRAGTSTQSAEQAVNADETSLSSARRALAADQAQATNPNSTFTSLPAPGSVITRGEPVFWLDERPVPLIYGTATLYRDLAPGVPNGPDVLELERNLVGLGYQCSPASPHFSTATEAAVRAWQAALHVQVTGTVALGDVVLESGPIRVQTVAASVGSLKSPGETVLSASSSTLGVTANVDASDQSDVRVGDRVTITLPNNTTTPGVVASVGTVVSSSSGASNAGNSGSGNTSGPTIKVEIRPTDPAAVGDLNAAPVTVAITNASVQDALVVPVDALLALASGGYAVEELEAGGVHRLIGVSTGLFDDADGLVQVSGAGLAAGQKIVVPNS